MNSNTQHDKTANDWFEIIRVNDHIILLRERLDKIEPRFKTKYTNLYLIIGQHSVILFDTGCGLKEIKNSTKRIIKDKKLIVINSHNHFDHIGGNSEFESIFVHKLDVNVIQRPVNVSFLKNSNKDFDDKFKKEKFMISPAQKCIPLSGDEMFDLGKIKVSVIHTPGHSPGSICLLTDMGDLFTGDTVHTGTIYLPDIDKIDEYLNTLKRLETQTQKIFGVKLYPGHEKFPLPRDIINKLHTEISIAIETEQKTIFDVFLKSWVIETRNFSFILPK